MHLLPLCPGFPSQKPSTLPILLQLDPEVKADADRPAMDLSLVIDRSSSMQGAPLQVACEAAKMAVAGLQSTDRVAVVMYDNEVNVLVGLQHPLDKPAIQAQIGTITPRGSTALFPGWEAGAQELLSKGQAALRRVLLLTDGEANVGLQQPDAIATHVTHASRQGVQTTTLGFGSGYNEHLLRSMAAAGNGNHYFVERSGQLGDFFNLELAGLEATMGNATELRAQALTPGVKVHLLQDLPVNPNGAWRLADLVAGSQMLLLLEVEIPDLKAGPHRLARLELSWTVPRTGERQSREFLLELPAGQATYEENPRVREQLALRDAALAQKEAAEALTAGQKERAEQALQRGLESLNSVKGSQSVVLTRQLKEQVAQIRAGQHQVASKKMTQQYYSSRSSVSLTTTPLLKPRVRARQLSALLADGTFPMGLDRALLQDMGFVIKVEPAENLWDPVRSMLIGVSIGDALGASTRNQQPEARSASYGEITDYVNSQGTRIRGGPTDLSRLTFWTLECMVDQGEFEPEVVSHALARRPLGSNGVAIRGFVDNLNASTPWTRAGLASAGNGALVRVPAVVTSRLFQKNATMIDALLFAGMTHRDSAALSSAGAYAQMLFELIRMDVPPIPSWWWSRYLELAAPLESDQTYTVRSGVHHDWSGRLSQFVQRVVPAAYNSDLSVADACRSWGSGSYLLETLPSALYILARHADHPEQAMLRAINDTVDNSAIAAVVGACLGALHGSCWPQRWIDENDFRTTHDDPGAVLRIVDQACNMFLTFQI